MDLGADSEEYDVKVKWVRLIRRNNMVVAVYHLLVRRCAEVPRGAQLRELRLKENVRHHLKKTI